MWYISFILTLTISIFLKPVMNYVIWFIVTLCMPYNKYIFHLTLFTFGYVMDLSTYYTFLKIRFVFHCFQDMYHGLFRILCMRTGLIELSAADDNTNDSYNFIHLLKLTSHNYKITWKQFVKCCWPQTNVPIYIG